MTRYPYVDDDDDEANACRRSADIDLSEADIHRAGSEDWLRCIASAEYWMTRAEAIEAARGPAPAARRPLLAVVCPCGLPRLPARPCASCGRLTPAEGPDGVIR